MMLFHLQCKSSSYCNMCITFFVFSLGPIKSLCGQKQQQKQQQIQT